MHEFSHWDGASRFVLHNARAVSALVLFLFLESPCPLEAAETDRERVALEIPAAYGPWRVEKESESWLGPRSLALSPGEHRIQGELGWAVDVSVSPGNIAPRGVVPGPYGRDLGGLFCYGLRLALPLPQGMRAILSLPREAGSYRIEGLLPGGTGDRAVFLPEGETPLLGKNWRIRLRVKNGTLTAGWDKTPGPRNEKKSRPVLRVEGDLLLWLTKTGDIAPVPPQEAAIQCFIPRGRTAFRRDETILVGAYIELPSPRKATFRLLAREEEKETELWSEVLSFSAGRETLSFEFSAVLLHPGTYTLRAALDGMPSEVPLVIVPSPEETPSRAVVIAAHLSGAPEKAAQTGATGWLMQGSRSTEGPPLPVHSRMEAATREGLLVHLYSADAQRLEKGLPVDASVAEALGRADAILAMRARGFAAYHAFVQGGVDPGRWPLEA
ncbi:MAG: hypothetical protein V1918_01445, partial [Planctomycetota bacterium]